jgi:hypothetical protein
VTVLPNGPSLDAPRKPRVVGPAEGLGIVIVCAADKLLTLSLLVPGVPLGQVKVRPPAVTVPPGVILGSVLDVEAASAAAEYASPLPSKFPNAVTGVTVSFVVPALLKGNPVTGPSGTVARATPDVTANAPPPRHPTRKMTVATLPMRDQRRLRDGLTVLGRDAEGPDIINPFSYSRVTRSTRRSSTRSAWAKHDNGLVPCPGQTPPHR